MTFESWLTTRYTSMAAEYRMNLAVITRTCAEYAEGNVWEEKHTAMITGLIKDAATPLLGKYPGEATAEERAWFKTALKPDWEEMKREAINTITALASNASI